MARTQPGCVGKFSVVVLILMFTKQKNLNLSAQLLTVLFGRQPICTTANFFSRGGSDRPYFLTFLARTQASMYARKYYARTLILSKENNSMKKIMPQHQVPLVSKFIFLFRSWIPTIHPAYHRILTYLILLSLTFLVPLMKLY